MVRILVVGLVAALVLVSGPAAREPLTKGEYISVVRAITRHQDDRLLFDEVVNFTYFPCSRLCRTDRRTAMGRDWLRSERLLRREMDAITERFVGLRPPPEVARAHAEWMAALRRCSASLRSLESDQNRFASGDFEKEVAQRLGPACFERFNEIIPAFEQRGYVFAPAS